MKTFSIGDTVYRASYDRVEIHVPCPDCLGSKHVKMTLGDGTELLIECGGCNPGGYNPPTGYIKQYEFAVVVTPRIVTGLTVTTDSVEYLMDGTHCSWHVGTPEDTFATRDEASAYGESLRLEHQTAENARLMAKTRDDKSWAWNATYHRNAIKQAERDLEYHRQKVVICAAKAKP